MYQDNPVAVWVYVIGVVVFLNGLFTTNFGMLGIGFLYIVFADIIGMFERQYQEKKQSQSIKKFLDVVWDRVKKEKVG